MNHEITNVMRLSVSDETLLNINRASPDSGMACKGKQADAMCSQTHTRFFGAGQSGKDVGVLFVCASGKKYFLFCSLRVKQN